jgi:hypothetical protein
LERADRPPFPDVLGRDGGEMDLLRTLDWSTEEQEY